MSGGVDSKSDDDEGIDLTDDTTKGPSGSGRGKKNASAEYRYEVIEPDRISQLMRKTIQEVTNVIGVSPTTARMLLNHFKWDVPQLLEKYYDQESPEKLFNDAHISLPDAKKSEKRTGPSSSAEPSSEECAICWTEYVTESMPALECGHRFCTTCWSQYLTTKIMDHGMGQSITCAAHGCGTIVDDGFVMNLLQDTAVKNRYNHLITNSFVECNKVLRWCPSTNCTNAVRVQYPAAKSVQCKCGFEFCFGCGHEWHDPVNCAILRKWIKKCNDDGDTSNWLLVANKKECPNCKITVEKDGGSSHMTCKNCDCQYCWLCLGPWEPHGFSCYSCNRFDDANAKEARDAQEKSGAALERYLFFCNRYMNHKQSLTFEKKLYDRVKRKMEEMQLYGMSSDEVQFLRTAVDVLCQCRRTLMYSYAFVYYLKKNNQTIIFEDNQTGLAMATEQLSEFLEQDLDKAKLTTLKQSVQYKDSICELRRELLLDHCREGDEKGWWQFGD